MTCYKFYWIIIALEAIKIPIQSLCSMFWYRVLGFKVNERKTECDKIGDKILNSSSTFATIFFYP